MIYKDFCLGKSLVVTRFQYNASILWLTPRYAIDNLSTQLPLTETEKLAKLNKLFGSYKNQPDLTSIFIEIDQQRHAYQGRTIDLIDNQDY